MKVMKFGGSCLRTADDLDQIAEIIKTERDQKVVVLSGLKGVTDIIQQYLDHPQYRKESINVLIKTLRKIHHDIIQQALSDEQIRSSVKDQIKTKLQRLETILYGVLFVEELTQKTRDLILSHGERLSVPILEGKLISIGLRAKALEADKIGIITNGDFGNATANLPQVHENLSHHLPPLLNKNIIPIITGFFGCNTDGHTTVFGRNGSDYSASVIAHCIDAETLELWKNVNGFMNVDPTIVTNAHLISHLSYDEAAELSYFGAKIIHPRTVDPLIEKHIQLIIKNTFDPRCNGTTISETKTSSGGIKSIAYSNNIACLKIYGSGVGIKPGVLSEITSLISEHTINIKSVITSQTCITLLLERNELEKSYKILSSHPIKTVEHIEKISNISLIAVVGEGILHYPGIAAAVFSSIAEKNINIEMISAGASKVAYYFIIQEKNIDTAINTIHETFFLN